MGEAGLTDEEYAYVCTLARYQFGNGFADAIDAERPVVDVHRSRSGRIDRLFLAEGRLGTITTAGRLTLGFAGGALLHRATEPPAHRVAIDDEAVPFVAEGKNAFAKFVRQVDPHVRPRDEVLVVDDADDLVAVGRASLSAGAMSAFERGMAVAVRVGRDDRPTRA